MSDYRGQLANCVLRGIELTAGTRDGQPWEFRNLLRLKVAGFELELHQDINLPTSFSQLARQCVPTTNLFVRNVAQGDVARLQEVIEHVCDLLSFATESRVLPYAHEYPLGSNYGQHTAMVGTVQIWRPPFQEPEEVKHFVELCFNRYEVLRGPRMLHVAIDYIHHSVLKGLATEVQIGLACIAFENLRHNWARDAGYPFLDGFFREKGGTVANPGRTVGLRRHLSEMFAEVGMNASADRIYDIRNEVIHTGLYGKVQNDDAHEFLETALREYFLRLIGYQGRFFPYIGGSPAPQVIP